MRTISIMNNKGGVGKTVTAINLADILVRDYKKRVLLVDCDGQMNLTRFMSRTLTRRRSTPWFPCWRGTGRRCGATTFCR